jgi:hypothetical protein
MSKYKIKEDFFNQIDTSDKAYFLGFLLADGCLTEEKKEARLFLQEDDKDILIKLNNIVQPDKPLYVSDRSKSKERNYKIQYGLILYGEQLITNLISHGCCSNKTENLKFPHNISPELISHVIRGYFDGDGHIGTLSNKSRIVICGTFDFCNDLKLLLNNMFIKCSVYAQGKIYKLGICGKHDIAKFCDFIYKDKNEFFLERKYQRYLEFYQAYKEWVFTDEKRYTKNKN